MNTVETKNEVEYLCKEIKGIISSRPGQEEAISVSLTKEFLRKSPRVKLNVDLSLLLMHRQIISIKTWQKAFAEY